VRRRVAVPEVGWCLATVLRGEAGPTEGYIFAGFEGVVEDQEVGGGHAYGAEEGHSKCRERPFM
jgi:hypothetical protein